MRVYWIDTGFMVQNWHRLHKKPRYPKFWEFVAASIDKGVIRMPKIAYNELMKKEDDLTRWCRDRRERGLCVPIDPDVEEHYRYIAARVEVTRGTRHQKAKSLSGADLWVIAYARATANSEGVVVTQEDPAKKNDYRVKMPNVCRDVGVVWMDTYLMLDDLDPRF